MGEEGRFPSWSSPPYLAGNISIVVLDVLHFCFGHVLLLFFDE